jgi:hypothetical protein
MDTVLVYIFRLLCNSRTITYVGDANRYALIDPVQYLNTQDFIYNNIISLHLHG